MMTENEIMKEVQYVGDKVKDILLNEIFEKHCIAHSTEILMQLLMNFISHTVVTMITQLHMPQEIVIQSVKKAIELDIRDRMKLYSH